METNKQNQGMGIGKILLIILGVIIGITLLFMIITMVALNTNPGELKNETAGLKLQKDALELQMHLERYKARFEEYPSEEQGLLALFEKPKVGKVPENWRPIINTKKAIEDPWGTVYMLKFKDNELSIITLGKDKKEGGEGINADFDILKIDTYPKGLIKLN